MIGPSTRDLASHHLTEAIRHLYAAASFVRETDCKNADGLALSLEGCAEDARATRGEVEQKP
jgi:hypothetical protein